jgi:hypothetical protein
MRSLGTSSGAASVQPQTAILEIIDTLAHLPADFG